MQLFTRVVDTGSFTAAAEQLGISRALASKLIQNLEDSLGVRLLNRTTRRLSLT
ncbi:MAG: helix-turn-helix domain-containing protein, partial [Rhodanobacteraceae bacterium]